jgi:hypothetical protein
MFSSRLLTTRSCLLVQARNSLRRLQGGGGTTTRTRRNMSFNFTGAKTLNEILKTELIQDKSKTEIADLWYTYHENKVRNGL